MTATPSTADDRDRINGAVRKAVRRIGRRVLVNRPVFNAAILGEEPDEILSPEFVTIPQMADEHPAFSEAALRQLIARAEHFAG